MRVLLLPVAWAVIYFDQACSVLTPADLKANVIFKLITRSNTNGPARIYIGDAINSNFNAGKKTKLIVHGFAGSADMQWVVDAKNNYLVAQDVNVFTVDWGNFASLIGGYDSARINVKDVGGYLAEFVDFLFSSWGLNFDSVHCVGHSLGAHLCGYAGKAVKKGKLRRISGLDPAGVQFDPNTPGERLAVSDAVFIDVLHTATNTLGYLPRLGHVDIYVNGGEASQPGCSFLEILFLGACSHFRAYEYFIESISKSPTGFVARRCSDNWLTTNKRPCSGASAFVGEYNAESTIGIYYLRTASQSPFALN